MKEATYQHRMNQTLDAKVAAIKSHVKPGDRVLDFGSGASRAVMDYVTSVGATYQPVDSDPGVQDYFRQLGVDCLPSLDGTKYDVVFLSSVVHEVRSHLERDDADATMRQLTQSLSDGGRLIIRDWYIHKDFDHTVTMRATDDRFAEVKEWYDAMPKQVDKITINGLTFTGPASQMYELAYHSVWGRKSLPRESQETYAIPHDELSDYLSELTEISRQDHVDTSYEEHMGKYFEDALSFISNNPSKTIMVYQK